MVSSKLPFHGRMQMCFVVLPHDIRRHTTVCRCFAQMRTRFLRRHRANSCSPRALCRPSRSKDARPFLHTSGVPSTQQPRTDGSRSPRGAPSAFPRAFETAHHVSFRIDCSDSKHVVRRRRVRRRLPRATCERVAMAHRKGSKRTNAATWLVVCAVGAARTAGAVSMQRLDDAAGVAKESYASEDVLQPSSNALEPIERSVALEAELDDTMDPFDAAEFYSSVLSEDGSSFDVVQVFPLEDARYDGEEAGETGGAAGRSVCYNNPEFRPLFPSARDICRVYFNLGNNKYSTCTGAFVDNLGITEEQTFVTAANCVLNVEDNWDFSVQDLDEYPSFVCCSAPLNNGSSTIDQICPRGYRWRVRGITVPSSYHARKVPVAIDDASLLYVRPYPSTWRDPVPFGWGTVPTLQLCDSREYEYTGYPVPSRHFQGCSRRNLVPEYFYASIAQNMLNCQWAMRGSQPMIFAGSACPRMSGSPLFTNFGGLDVLVGVLSSFSNDCDEENTSSVAFARAVLNDEGLGFDPQVLIAGLQHNLRLVVE